MDVKRKYLFNPCSNKPDFVLESRIVNMLRSFLESSPRSSVCLWSHYLIELEKELHALAICTLPHLFALLGSEDFPRVSLSLFLAFACLLLVEEIFVDCFITC